jgi:carboxyl-terminal processing protease
MIIKKKFSIVFSIILILSAFLILGYIAGNLFPIKTIQDEYPLFHEAHDLLKRYSYYQLPDDIDMQRGMISGFTQVLDDPYSIYMNPVQQELEEANLAGEYGGIGVTVQFDMEEGKFRLYPYPDSPADNAGVREGDFLIEVDSTSITSGLSIDEVEAALHGPVPSTVAITIESASPPYQISTMDIERETFSIPSVQGYLHSTYPEIGILRVDWFSDRTPDEITEVLQEILQNGAVALVLDLRGNSGGMLSAAVDTASLFLDDGEIVREIKKDGEERIFTAGDSGEFSELPLVVLVDQGTASAAEVVTAALQDNERAIIIGRKTYGKGSVQVVVTLSDNSSLHITNAIWLTPSGYSLEGSGVIPDIEIPFDSSSEFDPDMDSAINLLTD